jgi:hypothetical protein
MNVKSTVTNASVALEWDYTDETYIDGFRIYADNELRLTIMDTAKRSVPLADLGLSVGVHMLVVKAFNVVGESHVSNQVFLTIVDEEPAPPTNFRVAF